MIHGIETIVSLIFLIFLITSFVSLFYGAPIVFVDSGTLKRIAKLVGSVKGKLVADLGSGDGRIVIYLAKRGAIVKGFEISPILVFWSKLLIAINKLGSHAFIFWKDFWKQDLSKYDLVIVYGIGYIMPKLEKKLRKELKNDSRVITIGYRFDSFKLERMLFNVYMYKL